MGGGGRSAGQGGILGEGKAWMKRGGHRPEAASREKMAAGLAQRPPGYKAKARKPRAAEVTPTSQLVLRTWALNLRSWSGGLGI